MTANKPPDSSDDEQEVVGRPRLDLGSPVDAIGDRLGLARARELLFGPSSDTHPEKVGKYICERILGAGGMGFVYLARDPDLDRKVAIKQIRDGADLARFRREALALAKLSSPHVVAVFEIEHFDELAGPGIVMEFVEGSTLEEWLEKEPRSRAEILSKFDDAGRGLAAMHAAGLVHRDFKPANVLVRKDNGRALVADLGVARFEGSGPTDEFAAKHAEFETQAGARVGTMRYMAPEQFRQNDVDENADQFAFCVSLWHSLFGEYPFASDDEARTRIRVPRRKTTVPMWLRKVIERGLRAEPAARWPSMVELLDACKEIRVRRVRRRVAALVAVAAAGAAATAIKVGEERRVEIAISQCESDSRALAQVWSPQAQENIQAAFIEIDASMGLSTWQHVQPIIEAYVENWATVSNTLCLDAHVRQTRTETSLEQAKACLKLHEVRLASLVSVWSQPTRDMLPRAASVAAELPPPTQCANERVVGLQLTPDAGSQAEVTAIRADIDRIATLVRANQEQVLMDEAEAIVARADASEWPPLRAEAKLLLARVQRDLGKPELAYASAREAYVAALASGHDLEALLAADVLMRLAGPELNRHDECEQWREVAEALLTRIDQPGSIYEANLASAVGVVLRGRGEYKDAVDAGQRALSLHEELLGSDHISVSVDHINLGNALSNLGHHDDARKHYDAAIVILRQILGDQHSRLISPYTNIGNAYHLLADSDRAIDAYLKALEIAEVHYPPSHPVMIIPLTGLANEYYGGENYDLAKSYYERALAIAVVKYGDQHPAVNSIRSNLANIDLKQGRYQEALTSYQAALQQLELSLGASHPNLAMPLKGVGKAQLALGDVTAASSALTRARTILLEHESDPSGLASVNYYLAQAIWASDGDHEFALKLAQSSLVYFQSDAAKGLEAERDDVERWIEAHRNE